MQDRRSWLLAGLGGLAGWAGEGLAPQAWAAQQAGAPDRAGGDPLGSLQWPSLLAVVTFMITAMITANIVLRFQS